MSIENLPAGRLSVEYGALNAKYNKMLNIQYAMLNTQSLPTLKLCHNVHLSEH
jgi:hypothetical protein